MLNTGLWTVQVLLLVGFGIGAGMKLLMPIRRLSAIFSWTGDLPPPFVRGLGLIDLLGGIGVVLPMLTHVAPYLTVLAAIGCVLLQCCAIAFHLSRAERDSLHVNVILLVMAGFIAWGRWNLL